MNDTITYNGMEPDDPIIYTLANDIIFGLVMQDADVCRELLQRILPQRKIQELKLCTGSNVQLQKTIITGIIEKGVRLDVLFEGDDTWYDIEMQASEDNYLPKRGRYYTSAMDIDEINKGVPYSQLKTSYVIFICTFDHYGKGRAIYRFENYDIKNSLLYGDDSFKIIVNTACPKENTPPELVAFFDYMNSLKVPDDDQFITKIHNRVKKYNTPDWRRQIMTLEEQINEKVRRALEEGKSIGLAEGTAKGMIETCQDIGLTRGETAAKVAAKLSLSIEDIEKYINQYWN